MNRHWIIVLLLFQVELIFGQVDQIRQALVERNEERVMVVSHRGEWRQAPENSLKAIDLAIEAGVDIVEIDIAKTKDGQLILMHDKTLDRKSTRLNSSHVKISYAV